MLKKKIASVCIITVMATVLLGTFFVNRAFAPALKVNVMIESGLNPFPKIVQNDLDIVYVLVVATASGGTSPYTIEIWIRQRPDPYQRWAIYEQTYTYQSVPVLWSTNAPTLASQRIVDIRVKATDSIGTIALQNFLIYLPMSSPTA